MSDCVATQFAIILDEERKFKSFQNYCKEKGWICQNGMEVTELKWDDYKEESVMPIHNGTYVERAEVIIKE